MSDSRRYPILKPAAWLYRFVVQVRNACFDKNLSSSWQAPLPVISIGNITAGGTGKTPLAQWIINYYISIGERPALLSRGYGRSTKGVLLVSDGYGLLCGSREAGDETAMLAAKNPGIIVVTAEKRREGAAFIAERFSDRMPSVIVLDDAFQHRQIARNLDIVVVNAAEAYFDAAMLPEGRLREPLKNLRRADIAVLTKITDKNAADSIAEDLKLRGLPVVQARTEAGGLIPFRAGTLPETLSGCRIFAFAGIGAPARFIGSLEEMGALVEARRFFRDHEPYSKEKLVPVLEEARRMGLVPVTTEKDYYRMLDEPWFAELSIRYPLHFLEISVAFIEGQRLLEQMLKTAIRSSKQQ
jgi:tetraacyldisaccharide 4'-kinase